MQPVYKTTDINIDAPFDKLEVPFKDVDILHIIATLTNGKKYQLNKNLYIVEMLNKSSLIRFNKPLNVTKSQLHIEIYYKIYFTGRIY